MLFSIDEIETFLDSLCVRKEGVKSKGLYCVTIDSRISDEDSIFIAIRGESLNGHDYIESALKKGVRIFIVSEDVEALKDKENVFVIYTDDTLKALQKVAAGARKKITGKVIAITGSNGKTTTKNILHHVLLSAYKCHMSPKSFNNHIGVPLTIISTPEETEILILEIGMNHSGEIKELMKIAEPDIGVILNAGRSHLGNFKNESEVLKAKAEMYHYIKNMGIIILNEKISENEIFKQRDDVLKYIFGSKNADLKYRILKDYETLSIEVEFKEKVAISSCLKGEHNAENIAAVCLVARILNTSFDDIQNSLKTFKGVAMRYEKKTFAKGVIINDAYNANPDSFKAAIRNFSQEEKNNRRIVVVGEMLELGEFSEKCHLEVFEYIKNKDIDFVIGIGQGVQCFSKFAEKDFFVWFPDVFAAKEKVASYIEPDDIVLLKGSRGNKLELLEPYIERGMAS